MENGKSTEQRGFTISNLLLEGSLGVFLAVVLFVVFIIIFSDGFLTSSNFFATSRAFSLWIVVGFSQLMALVIGHLNLSAGAIGGLYRISLSSNRISSVVSSACGNRGRARLRGVQRSDHNPHRDKRIYCDARYHERFYRLKLRAYSFTALFKYS